MKSTNHTRSGREARERRQQAAVERQSRVSIGNEQIARLDQRLGKGVGAVRERARLERAS